MKVTIVSPKMKKSCGQKTFPKIINRALGILNRNKGLPFTDTKGRAKKIIKNPPLI
jgi:hypothetical protein